jgi:hypothetical protein
LAGVSRQLRARPQGTKIDRAVTGHVPTAGAASDQAPPADAGTDEFNFGFGGSDGEFNFTKFLDDPPPGTSDASDRGPPPDGGT